MRRSRLLLAVAALAVALVACGDDGASTSTTVPAAPDAGAPATTTAEGISPDVTPPAEAQAYCEVARAIDEDAQQLTVDDLEDSARVEEVYTGLVRRLGEAREVAPEEIRQAVADLEEGTTRLVDLVREGDWDIRAVSESAEFLELIETDRYNEASDSIDEYNRTVCGLG
jgi:hypothetical protein